MLASSECGRKAVASEMVQLRSILRGAFVVAWVLAELPAARAAEAAGVEEQLRTLAVQNRELQEQVAAQQKLIEGLAAKLAAMEKKDARREEQLEDLRERTAGEAASLTPEAVGGSGGAQVRLSGEVGLAYFKTGRAGAFPKAEFRVDDARIGVEAAVMTDVYFFGQIDLRTREGDATFALGEFYVDFEDVSGRLGGKSRLLNVRAGQIDIPFGEEYQRRGPVANPLISHSLSDIWGYDPGIEAYGSLGAWSYVVAVQNGGINTVTDFNADKSLTARLGWTPAPWLQLSASALRTGEIQVGTAAAPGDFLTALWFGNGFFRSISPGGTARNFWVDVWEGDATARWKGGHVSAAFGGVRYADDDYVTDNSRRLHYGFLEAVQNLGQNFYGAARWSGMRAPKGYPVAGWGNMGRYFFAPSPAKELERLSLGFGYKFGPPLVLKLEYAWEWGHQLNGAPRDQEDFVGAEIGLTF